MNGASRRQFLGMLCGLAVLGSAGCADMDLPSWVPFQSPASDKLPEDLRKNGLVVPRERIEDLRKKADIAAGLTPEERKQISMQLVDSIRTERRPADPPGNYPHAGSVSERCG